MCDVFANVSRISVLITQQTASAGAGRGAGGHPPARIRASNCRRMLLCPSCRRCWGRWRGGCALRLWRWPGEPAPLRLPSARVGRQRCGRRGPRCRGACGEDDIDSLDCFRQSVGLGRKGLHRGARRLRLAACGAHEIQRHQCVCSFTDGVDRGNAEQPGQGAFVHITVAALHT